MEYASEHREPNPDGIPWERGLKDILEVVQRIDNRFAELNTMISQWCRINKNADGVADSILGEEINAVISQARPEIEMIYQAIKKLGLSGHSGGVDVKWKEAALNTFGKKSVQIKFIEKEYLEDINLYAFAPGQARRDVIGTLLKRILKDLDLGDYGAQRLYGIYKRLVND